MATPRPHGDRVPIAGGRLIHYSALVVALLACLTGDVRAQPATDPEELALRPKIAEGVESLLDRQLRDGSWGVHGNYLGGRTALCAYTLVKAGVQMDHPAMRRAFAYLDNVTPDKTYATACMMLAYGATAEKRYRPRLQMMLGLLLEWQRPNGTWGYPGGNTDLSNTQYAALGLWGAQKAGLKVPTNVWQKLVEGTIDHREEPAMAKRSVGKGTGAAKVEVAGFAYRPPHLGKPTHGHHMITGSMTTAGIAILKICEIGMGRRLRKAARRRITAGIDGGVNWMARNFSVSSTPGIENSRINYYYLYGLERVGSLLRQEQIGEHKWYVAGAQQLLKSMKKGRWGHEVDTSFAILFLRRATKIGRPVTGSAGNIGKHMFSSGGPNDDVALRAAGQQPLAIYINGFGKILLARHSEFGLRIPRVDYYDGKRKVGQLAADPKKAWQSDTFLYNFRALSRGPHVLNARRSS